MLEKKKSSRFLWVYRQICDGYMTSKGARRVFFTLKIIPFSGKYKGNVVPRHNSPFPSIVIVIIACY